MTNKVSKQAIVKERLKLIYSSLVISNLGMLFTGLILVYTLRNDISHFRLILWVSILIVACIFAQVTRYLFSKNIKKHINNIYKWERLLIYLVTIFGILWASSSLFLFPYNSISSQSFLILTTVGVVAGSISFLSPSIKLITIFIPLCIFPLAYMILISGSANGISISILLLAFLIISLIHGKNYNYRTTLQLTLQEDLLQAKKESDKANKLKSDFLANMSHEIRTPMNGVIGNNNLMLQHPLSKDQRNRAIAIQNSAESMLTIIKDILDFSKIEAGKINIEYIDFNFNNMIQILSSSVINRVKEKKLEFICHVDPRLDCWVLGDSIRIRQVLENLIDNALKFTNFGKIEISCNITRESEQFFQVKVEIIDTGEGISKDSQKSIFNRFTQADGSTTRKFGGTGLGLSICKQLIKLMGGNIGFESNENLGSTFWILLNLKKTNAPDTIKERRLKNNTFTGKILIVDDNDINRMVLDGMLDIYNIETDLVENGESAIQSIKKNHYDLILMDCHMPVMDGYDATKLIRKNELEINQPRIPIIAVTASAMQGDKEKCYECGMDDYISKPIKLEELQNKLSLWLQ